MQTPGNTAINTKKSSRVLWSALLMYGILGIAQIPWYRYQINPDGISYISIAEKYWNGDYSNAINGHFSPLFSWLLVPFIAFNIEPLLGAKLLNLLIGIVAILAMRFLTYRFFMSEDIRTAILVSSIPVVWYFAFYLITPDLLVSCLLLFYFSHIFADEYSQKSSYGVVCGMFGGLSFLAKSYSFPFILYHFPTVNLIHYLRSKDAGEKTRVLKNFLTGMLVFVLISSAWILAISNKYGYFTISTQTHHNLQLISPDPPRYPSLIRPPNETAISIWEDLYSVVPPGTWSPLKSLADFKVWLKFALSNSIPTFKIVWGFSPFVFILSGAYVLFLLLRRDKGSLQYGLKYEMMLLLITMLPYAAGYCLILVEERYIWILCFLFMLMGGSLLNTFFTNACCAKTARIAILLLFVASFSLVPLTMLAKNINNGKQLHILGASLQRYIPPGSKIVSSDYWYKSLYLAYHIKAKIYGTAEVMTPEDLQKGLNLFAIDYFIAWKASKKNYPFLAEYKKIEDVKNPELTTYCLHEKAVKGRVERYTAMSRAPTMP